MLITGAVNWPKWGPRAWYEVWFYRTLLGHSGLPRARIWRTAVLAPNYKSRLV